MCSEKKIPYTFREKYLKGRRKRFGLHKARKLGFQI